MVHEDSDDYGEIPMSAPRCSSPDRGPGLHCTICSQYDGGGPRQTFNVPRSHFKGEAHIGGEGIVRGPRQGSRCAPSDGTAR